MPDQFSSDARSLLTDKINGVERNLKEDIDAITLPMLIGKWVSEHMATVGISSAVTVIMFIGSIVLGVFWVTDEFVQAAELDRAQTQIQQDVTTLRYQSRADSLETRRWFTEQRLADIQSKRNLTPEDRARAEQLLREIARIESELRQTNEKVERLQQPIKPSTR